LEQKHIFGLGVGMIIIEIAYGGILSAKINQHNFVTIVLIIIGTGLIGFKIIESLI